MFTIRKISKRKDIKKFVRFPTELYKDCKNYVPPMESDEYKMATKKNAHYKECEQAYFLAEDENGKVVGRIACLVMHPFNEKNNDKLDVIYNNDLLTFDVEPIIENGRTLVPFRTIFETMGCAVYYSEEDGKQIVSARRADDSLVLHPPYEYMIPANLP